MARFGGIFNASTKKAGAACRRAGAFLQPRRLDINEPTPPAGAGTIGDCIMTAKTSFKGSFTALVTPFKNGSLDEVAFRGLVDWQIGEGTSGLVPVGTTGGSPT